MRRWWNVKRFDLWELCLIVALAGFCGWLFVSTRPEPLHPEALPLERAYGPAHNSENEEEWIIKDFFAGRRDGFFLDVGASHYRINSNTYFLEHDWGWSGLAVEPFTHFEADYLANRPRTRFLPFFVSDVSGEEAKMYTFGPNFLASSTEKTFVERFGKNPAEL